MSCLTNIHRLWAGGRPASLVTKSACVTQKQTQKPLSGLGPTALLPCWKRSYQRELGGNSSQASPAADTWLQHCCWLPWETPEGSIRSNGKPLSEPSLWGEEGKGTAFSYIVLSVPVIEAQNSSHCVQCLEGICKGLWRCEGSSSKLWAHPRVLLLKSTL